MRFTSILSSGVALAGFVAPSRADYVHHTQTHMFDISPKSLDELIDGGNTVLVSFQTSAGCPECDAVTRELQELQKAPVADTLVKGPYLVTVNCDKEVWRERCTQLDVNSWPAVRIVDEKGGWSRYRGPRDAAWMYSALIKTLLPGVTVFDSLQKAEIFVAADSNVVLISGTGDDIDALTKSAAISHGGEYLIGRIDGSTEPGFKPNPSVICYKQILTLFRGKEVNPSTDMWSKIGGADLRDNSKVTALLDDCAKPAVHRFSRRKVQQLYALQRPIAYIFRDSMDSSPLDILSSVKKWSDYMSFVQVRADQNQDLMTALDLDPSADLPLLSVEGVINADVYPMPEDWPVEADNVDAFIEGILKGKASGGKAGQGWLEKAGLIGRKKFQKEKPKDEL